MTMTSTKNTGWASTSYGRNLGLCFLALASSAVGYESGVRGTGGGTTTSRRLDDKKNDQDGRPVSKYLMKKKEVPKGRPIMHTYFDETNSFASFGSSGLLSTWEAAWHDAGWDTRVLNITDARLHHDFHMLDEVLEGTGNGGISKYEKACFYRWFAMAAVLPEDDSGGWMSDYDNLPFNIQPSMGHELPNDGEFTAYDGAVPDLMSGTKSEWDRITHFLITTGIPNAYGGYVSDMNSLVHLRDKYGLKAGHFESGMVTTGWQVDARGDFDCEKIPEDILAIHYSHRALEVFGGPNGWFEAATGDTLKEAHTERSAQLIGNRSKMASTYREAWKSNCRPAEDH